MAYDLEEQEQLASFKAFWNQYGNFILTVVTVVLVAVLLLMVVFVSVAVPSAL